MAEGGDEFETRRLVVRDLQEGDLDAALSVYLSNPEYLALTEGARGEPGRYDIEMLQRDYVIARATPGRHMAGVFLKTDGELVGLLDWLEANPSDEKPWIGLLMIRADHQRQGVASETFDGFAGQLRADGLESVRAGVISRNSVGRALMHRLGFEPIATTTMRMASEEEVVVLERRL